MDHVQHTIWHRLLNVKRMKSIEMTNGKKLIIVNHQQLLNFLFNQTEIFSRDGVKYDVNSLRNPIEIY